MTHTPIVTKPIRLKLIVLAVVLNIALPVVARSDDWPRLLNADFDNAAGEDSKAFDFTARPSVAWTLPVGDGYGLGVVKDNVYFHFDAVADTAVRGRHQSRLRAIDLGSGDVIWHSATGSQYRDLYGYESGPRTSPTIAGDMIYTMSVAGEIIARRTSDGQIQWRLPTSEQFGVVQNFFGAGGSPLVVGETLFAMVGGSPAADQSVAPGRLDRVSPNQTLLVAVNRFDGEVRWSAGGDLASYSSPRTITLDHQTYILLYGRDSLWCIDPTNGTVAWNYRHRADILETVNAMMPVVVDDQIFISECYSKGSVLLKATGNSVTELWKDPPGRRRQQSMRVHWSTPVRHGDFLFGCSGRNAPDSSLRCIRWKTGEQMWEAMSRKRTSVTKLHDYFIVWGERGDATIAALDERQFRPVAEWSVGDLDGGTDLAYPCWASPVVIDGRILLRGDQAVACLQFPRKLESPGK